MLGFKSTVGALSLDGTLRIGPTRSLSRVLEPLCSTEASRVCVLAMVDSGFSTLFPTLDVDESPVCMLFEVWMDLSDCVLPSGDDQSSASSVWPSSLTPSDSHIS